MNIISVKQLRENFSEVKDKVERGQSLILIYRSKPLAEIKPISFEESEQKRQERLKKNKLKIHRLAGGLKLGKGLSPKQLNKLYDKEYEQMLS